MEDIIKFYRVSDEYGEFSNFAKFPIKIDGKIWPTSEHYFQAMKFESNIDQDDIRNAKTAMDAARKGRDRKRKLKNNWESIKDNVMRKALEAKFRQHEELKSMLINTGQSTIIEHTKNDSYWGDGGNGSGKNMLGLLLMETRDKLKR
jgi:N-glycosidase YbiA